MKGSSPISKDSRLMGNSPSELSNVVNKSKNSNGMTLLSMWKIEGGKKSAGHASGVEMSPVPPRKKSKVSPKPSREQTTPVERSTDSKDLGYCPNCQMPFTALIKQSTNWHITDCMDFDYNSLKECPSGVACSSTISSHYMKYAHYSLAKKRSEISRNTKSSPSGEKCNTFSSVHEIEEKVVNPPSSPKSVEATVILPRKVELARRVTHIKRSLKGISQDEVLTKSRSAQQSIALTSSAGIDKERCSPDCNRSSGEVSHGITENSDFFSKCTVVGNLELGALTESKCDLGEHFSQLFQTPITGSVVFPKTFSFKNRSLDTRREEYFNDTKDHNQRQKLSVWVPETSNKNICPENSNANFLISNCGEEIIVGLRGEMKCIESNYSTSCVYNEQLNHTIVEMRNSSVLGSEASESNTENRKSVNSYLDAACKDNKNNIYSQKDCFDNWVVADDYFPTGDLTVGDTAEKAENSGDNCSNKGEIFIKDESKINLIPTVVTKASSDNKNDIYSQEDCFDNWVVADDYFPTGDLTVVDTAENSGDNCSNKGEIFIKDESKINLIPTVVTKASSEKCHNFSVTSSQVYLEKTNQKDNTKTGLLSNYGNQVQCGPSSQKRQTSLISFFKSSSVKTEDTQNMKPVFYTNEKLKQTKSVMNRTKVESNFVHDSTLEKNRKSFEKTQVFNVDKAENSKRPFRVCPFYKKIPDTTFCVDAFNYGSIPGIRHYFLSHFHYDHYGGLTRNFCHPLYCSVVTANLVSLKIKVSSKFIHILKLNESTFIDNIEVTALDANHCPGSVMFLFRFPDGRNVLHTGDFRAIPEMELYPSLQNCIIETLYLDTTYCNPRYDFPSQDSVLNLITSLVVPRMKNNVKLLVVCGSYTIGKERAFMAVAEHIGCKIWAEKPKLEILKQLEDQQITSHLVTSPADAKIHVLPMNMINLSTLQHYLLKFVGTFDEIIGLKPTGWEHNSNGSSNIFSLKPICQGPVTIYDVPWLGTDKLAKICVDLYPALNFEQLKFNQMQVEFQKRIPYSEHSSFSELRNFVQFLRPRCIIPTVNVESASSRNQMGSYFKQWNLCK